MTQPFREFANVSRLPSRQHHQHEASKRGKRHVHDSEDAEMQDVDDGASSSRAQAQFEQGAQAADVHQQAGISQTDPSDDEDAVVEQRDDADVDMEEEQTGLAPSPRTNEAVPTSDNDVQDENREQDDNAAHVAPEIMQRRVKARYRQLGYNATEQQSSISDVSVADIGKTVEQANKLFRKVTTTAEAVLDSHVLLAASSAAALKARNLKIDAKALDTIEFLNRLVKFMGGRRSVARTQAPNAPLEMNLKWGRVGRAVAAESRRVPSCDFMLGPLEIQVKEKKARVQRQRQKVSEADRVRPEELKAEDVQKDKHETGKLVKQLNAVLEKQGAEGIPYLKFVINPNSFAQTVENVFYFSFLIRENKACIELEDDPKSPHYQDYICYSVAAPEDGQDQADAISKTQIVFEVTEQLWKDAIEAYEIEESTIPHRDPYEAVGVQANGRRTKW
ncbi:hypothetical protein OIV83_002307 [Microbotryomycetes sp. JL201]|nr:hypothetical protein OIV83_002307 [Microbotryomycetes sp. JL201]